MFVILHKQKRLAEATCNVSLASPLSQARGRGASDYLQSSGPVSALHPVSDIRSELGETLSHPYHLAHDGFVSLHYFLRFGSPCSIPPFCVQNERLK